MNEQLPSNVTEIIQDFSGKIYVIEEYMVDDKTYSNLIYHIFDCLRAGFEYKSLRECPVYFKFHGDGEIISVQLRHFLTNLIFWEPLIALGSVNHLDTSFIIDPKKISSGYIKSYIDDKIIVPYRNKISNKKLNKVIDALIYKLSRISGEFNIIMGNSINMESFMNVANNNERFNQIIRTKFNSNMQPNEIEAELRELMNETVNILSTEENSLRPMLQSGTGIKDKQLAEFFVNMGMKPDLQGNTAPIVINSNLTVGGLNSIAGYYIDATAGRKSLIFNKSAMGKSGHFSKKCMLLVSNVTLREDEKECRSVHPIRFEIKSKEHLRRLVGRMYRLPNEREYKLLSGNDTHVIGKTILVKSPITCASHKGVCKCCYGPTLYHTNGNGVGIGSYAGAIITNPLSQNILSAKHLLTTNSEKIEFDNNFYKYFKLNANEIVLNEDIDSDDYSLIIIYQNIVTLTELNEGEINKFLVMFHVKDNKTGEIIEIQEGAKKELYISPELNDLLDKHKKPKTDFCEIKFADIPDDNRLFLVQIENAELTRPLYKIMNLLDSKEKRGELGVSNIDDLAQVFLDLLIESKINVMSVHAEVMLTPLIRSIEDVLSRPDFKRYNAINDTQILTVSSALEKHPSPLIGLSSQFLGRQLISPLTFKKHGTSFIDSFYREHL